MKVQFDVSPYIINGDGSILNMVQFIKDTRENFGEKKDMGSAYGYANTFGLKIAKDICDIARNHYIETGVTKFVADSDDFPILLELKNHPKFFTAKFDGIKLVKQPPVDILKTAIYLLEEGEYDAAMVIIRVLKRKEK